MANRYFKDPQVLETGIVTLFCRASIGAGGDPTIVYGPGIASINDTGVGTYDVVLEDSYNRIVGFSAILLDPAVEDINFQLEADTVATNKTFSFFTFAYDTNGAAAVADPSNGATILFEVTLKNSSVTV